jgi:glycine amidinotransferase
MKSTNEWDKLKKVIVGVADYAKIPKMDRSIRYINYADRDDVSDIPSGPYPQRVIDEANEDLEIFVSFLKDQGVEVVRPHREPTEYYNFCPRDIAIVHGKNEIAAPMPLKARQFNYKSIEHHFNNLIHIPCSYDKQLYNEQCVGDKETLSLTEHEPSFDAANVIRANDDLLYLVSNSGNKKGAQKLQELLPDTKVHLLENVYSYMHIDTTIAFLREGLLLANPERIKSRDVLPGPFKNWDIIWCPQPVDIGYYKQYNNSSPWCNMNLFSISPGLVVLEEHQNSTRNALEQHGIECAMLPMRQSRTLSGCFHCVTLDLERE